MFQPYDWPEACRQTTKFKVVLAHKRDKICHNVLGMPFFCFGLLTKSI